MKDRLFSMRMVIYVSLTIVLLSGITYMMDTFQIIPLIRDWLNEVFDEFGMNITIAELAQFSSFDLLLAQISNTFIVLSLTVVLSTDVGCVYWIDIKDHKLVEPMFSCFIAIMTYLLSNLGFSIVSYLLGEENSLLFSFLVSILLLMWLSYKMISVYFGRSRMKRRLMLEYMRNKWTVDLYEIGCGDEESQNIHAVDAYGKVVQRVYKSEWIDKQFAKFQRKWRRIANKEKWMRMAEISRGKLYAYEEGVRENSIRALNEGKKDIIEENIHLLAPMDSNKSVLRLLSEIDVTNPGYAANLLYQLYMEGNYNPGAEAVKIYAKTLMEQLIEDECAPESIYNMSKLLGDLDGREDYFEILQHAMELEDGTEIDNYIAKRVIPFYDNELSMNCYKMVDELISMQREHNKTALDKYCNYLVWIKNKLEQEINATSIELALKSHKYPLLMRKIHFFSEDENARLEAAFEGEKNEVFERVETLNIYVFVDGYIVPNRNELMEAQSKYEKLRSIFGAKDFAVLRERTRLALAYNEAKDYQSTCNLFEANRAENTEDELELDLSNSVKAVAWSMCGYNGDAWDTAYKLYNKYKQISYDFSSDERVEYIYKNVADVMYSYGQYEWALNLDTKIFLRHSRHDEPAVSAYHRMVVDANAWKNKEKNENVLRYAYINQVTEKEWKEAYIRCKVKLGEEHSTTLSARSNYEMNRTDISEKERTEALHEIYLERVKIFGENHPDTISARLRFARRIATISPGKEIEHYRIVYDIRKRVLGELHPDTIYVLFCCWNAYIEQQNDVFASLYENKVYEIEQGIDAVKNQIALMRIRALISGYKTMGKQEKVLALYQNLYQKQKETYGEKSSILIDTMNNIAYEYADMNEFKKVVEYFDYACEEAYKIRDLEQMCQAKKMANLYRVKQQFAKDKTSSGYDLIRKFYQSRINGKKLSETKRLIERVDFFVIKANVPYFHEEAKLEWKELYQELLRLSSDYVKELLLVLSSAKSIYESECTEENETENKTYIKQFDTKIDEILQTLDNL